MSQVTITETFADADGNPIDPTTVVLENPTATYGLRRVDTEDIIVAAGVAMTQQAAGTYSYTFDEPVAADGITYQYWVKWTYQGHTDYDERSVVGETSDNLLSRRNTDKYLNWIKQEFQPLTLITPDDTLKQLLENAIRYFNTHSAYKISTMVDFATGQTRVQLPASFKQVAAAYPNRTTTWIWNDHPLWSLLGVMVLDNITTDLILLSEAFRNYRIYVGTNFRWYFHRSEDPTVGGYLYAVNAPAGSTGFFVVGTKRITLAEDIKEEFIVEWLLRYFKALVKQTEGNSLRKANMILPTGMDGQELVNEGMEEMKALQEELAENGRWVCFIRRQ